MLLGHFFPEYDAGVRSGGFKQPVQPVRAVRRIRRFSQNFFITVRRLFFPARGHQRVRQGYQPSQVFQSHGAQFLAGRNSGCMVARFCPGVGDAGQSGLIEGLQFGFCSQRLVHHGIALVKIHVHGGQCAVPHQCLWMFRMIVQNAVVHGQGFYPSARSFISPGKKQGGHHGHGVKVARFFPVVQLLFRCFILFQKRINSIGAIGRFRFSFKHKGVLL